MCTAPVRKNSLVLACLRFATSGEQWAEGHPLIESVLCCCRCPCHWRRLLRRCRPFRRAAASRSCDSATHQCSATASQVRAQFHRCSTFLCPPLLPRPSGTLVKHEKQTAAIRLHEQSLQSAGCSGSRTSCLPTSVKAGMETGSHGARIVSPQKSRRGGA